MRSAIRWSGAMLVIGASVGHLAAQECTTPISPSIQCDPDFMTLRDIDIPGEACSDLWDNTADPLDEEAARQPVQEPCGGSTADDLYRIYVLPDTQHYARDFDEGGGRAACAEHMYCQAKGIADEFVQDPEQKLVFVTHVGDIIQNVGDAEGSEEGAPGDNHPVQRGEWQFAVETYDQFLATSPALPHSLSMGCHDHDDFNELPLKDATCYVENFGPERYAPYADDWFLSSPPTSGSLEVNMIQKFQALDASGAPDGDILHVSLEQYASDAAIAWVQGVLRDHPETPVMLTTHSYLSSSTLRFRGSSAIDGDGSVLDGGGDNAGEEIFQKLIYPYPQIFLVISGHTNGNGVQRSPNFLTSVVGGTDRESVLEHLADYQGLSARYGRCSEGGLMHLLRFRENEVEIDTVSFSPPTLSEYSKDAVGCSRCEQLSVSSWRAELDESRRKIYRFRDDLTGNTRDTHLEQKFADAIHPSAGSLFVQTGDGSNHAQALIAFTDLFDLDGNDPSKIPASGVTIEKATLTLTTEGGRTTHMEGAHTRCDLAIHRMLVPWSPSTSTWDNLGGGVALDDLQAASLATASIPPCEPLSACDPSLDRHVIDWRGTRSFDVTADVADWHANSFSDPNYGWVIAMAEEQTSYPELCDPEDAAWIRSADWTVRTERPTLTVSVRTD